MQSPTEENGGLSLRKLSPDETSATAVMLSPQKSTSFFGTFPPVVGDLAWHACIVQIAKYHGIM